MSMIEGFNTEQAIDMMVSIELARTAPVHEGDQHKQASWGALFVTPDDLPNTDLIVDSEGTAIGVGTCGTSRCAAGWVLSNNKIPLRWDLLDVRGNVRWYETDTTADGREVPRAAAELLGIPWYEWETDGDRAPDYWDSAEDFPVLFAADNTVDDLYAMVSDYSGIPEQDFRDAVKVRVEAFLGNYQPVA